jgi:hypothetical protein
MAFRMMVSTVLLSMIPSGCSEASGFLSPQSGSVNVDLVRTSLLTEIDGALGKGDISRKVASIERAMRSMYISLPKNEYGNLGHTAVAYALYRYFVQRHGWSVDGIGPDGEGFRNAAPGEVFKGKVPSFIQSLLEEKLGGHGLDLHGVAVLAGTLEQLVFDDSIARLEAVYDVHTISTSQRLGTEQVEEVLDTYMMALLMGSNLTGMTTTGLQEERDLTRMSYPGWDDTQMYLRDMRKNVDYMDRHVANPFTRASLDFPAVVRVVEEAGNRFGRFQDLECRALKDTLLEHEEGDTGRIRLSDFYKAGLDGAFGLQESADYLRQLGALDDSNLWESRVIVANYVNSKTNCISSASFYSICCINECEQLQDHLEQSIAGPSASAARIASVVASLSSSTVDAPRNLTGALLQRLENIASSHGGSVPLHGRLFAQWMHHAFPRECPYPHVAGTTDPTKTAMDIGRSSMVSQKQMQAYVTEKTRRPQSTTAASVADEDEEEMVLPWSHEEELVVVQPATPTAASRGSVWQVLRIPMQLAAIGGLALVLGRTVKSSAKSMTGDGEKFSKFV